MTDAFLFPGQGSQAVGMGGWLCREFSAARKVFDEADDVLGEALSRVIEEGPGELLKQTANAQPAILMVSIATARVLSEKGIAPSIVAGHSLGEYSALVVTGALSFRDAVRLVRARGQYMQEAVPLGTGTMSAVLGAEDSLVETICREISNQGNIVEPANYNCPGQVVISGTVKGVALAIEKLKAEGAKRCVPLEVSAPFHSSLLKPAAERMEKMLESVLLGPLSIPYIANVDAEIIRTPEGIKQRLVDQVWKPVRWAQSLRKLAAQEGLSRVIEVGPGQVVSGHFKKISANLPRFTTDSVDSLRGLLG